MIASSASRSLSTGDYLVGILVLTFFFLLYFFSKTKKGKGIYGELRVRIKLKRFFGGRAVIFNNYILIDPEYNNLLSNTGFKSIQIDHIVVCEKGVLVIETKNYSGRLYGNSIQKNWTQVLTGGKVKHQLYNPIKQNATHCAYVKKIVGERIPVLSIIVLVKNNTRFLSCSNTDNVIGISELRSYLSFLPDRILDEAQINTVVQKLNESNYKGMISTTKHIRNINNRISDAEMGICPRCGGALVRRDGKYGIFWGCENYPRCKYTKH